MPKILVADDEEDQEELITQRFSNKDFLREYEFIFARDGLKAMVRVFRKRSSVTSFSRSLLQSPPARAPGWVCLCHMILLPKATEANFMLKVKRVKELLLKS